MKPSLLNPFGLDGSGDLIRVEDAKEGTAYRCPVCLEGMRLREGARVQKHFAHFSGVEHKPETVLHKVAKMLIVQAVKQWRSGGGRPPTIVRGCDICGKNVQQKVPGKVVSAVEELAVASGHVVDVALFSADAIVAAVEVRVTHAVDEEKHRRLPVPYLEVDAEELAHEPQVWRAISHRLNDAACRSCLLRADQLVDLVNRVARHSGQSLSVDPWLPTVGVCDECDRPMLVYWAPSWSGVNERGCSLTAMKAAESTVAVGRICCCPGCGATPRRMEKCVFFGLEQEPHLIAGHYGMAWLAMVGFNLGTISTVEDWLMDQEDEEKGLDYPDPGAWG